MARNKVQEVNAGSMADIAFLLLIFWLTTTSIDADKGLQRRLPPMPDENQKQEDVKVNRRNILQVKINSSDRILAGSQSVDVSQLKDVVIDFVTNPADNENLSEKEMEEIVGYGLYPVSKGVVSLQNDRGTSYNSYLQVQNEIVKAFNEIRDNFAMAQFGRKYAMLSEDQQEIVRKAIPQKISEAEPKDIGKK